MGKGWILSEKTLSLSEKEFDDWLKKSKASEKSKKRYKSDYKRYKAFKKQPPKLKVTVEKKIQKEGFYGRSVWFATARRRIAIFKRTFNNDIKQLRPIFSALYGYKRKAKYLMLKIKYRVIVSGKILSHYDFLGSTVQYANEFNFAYDNLIRKIKKMVFSASIEGIVIYSESIKFYAGRSKNA